MKQAKQAARRQILKLRDAAHDPAADAAIVKALTELDVYQNARTLAVYVSFGSELNTFPLIEQALSDGKRVAVPYCVPKTHIMKMLSIAHFPDDLHHADAAQRADRHDLIVVPGVGFTKRGERLGYGGGFYDRYLLKLKATAHLVALVPEFLLFDALPTEAHDLRIPTLITEKRIIDCSQFIE